jgi:hypothetical protein
VEWQQARRPLRPFTESQWESLYLYQKAARVHVMMCQYALRAKHLDHPQPPPPAHPPILDLEVHNMTRWDTPVMHHPAMVEHHAVLPPVGNTEAHLQFLSTRLIAMHTASMELFLSRGESLSKHNRGGAWHLEPILNPRGISFTQLLAWPDAKLESHIDWHIPLEQRWWYLGNFNYTFMDLQPPATKVKCDHLHLTLAERTHIWRMAFVVKELREMMKNTDHYGGLTIFLSPPYCGTHATHQQHLRWACYILTCIAFGMLPAQQRTALRKLLPKDYPDRDGAFDLLITKPVSVLSSILPEA